MSGSIVVTAPSRLHFGMFSFGVPTLRQYGGVGVMIDERRAELRITPAAEFACVGADAERLQQALTAVRATEWGRDLPPCRIEVTTAPPSHVGLGSGTQLSLAVVAGLRAWKNLPPLDVVELAHTAGRAKRSAVGLYGFLHGGLIAEAGRLPHDAVSPLIAAIQLPSDWRFVLIAPHGGVGLSGESERAAFAALPSVPPSLTEELCRIALLDLIPSARSGDFAGFAEAVYRFGYGAGQCFKSHQSGVYATELLAALVARIRAAGIAGVGQSSWGPTLFTLHPTQHAADQFVEYFKTWPGAEAYDVRVARPNAGGATISPQ
jgi:beta-ribofuranosylaminobenzene 5'-phosphate synthase